MNIGDIKRALEAAGKGKEAITLLFAEAKRPEKWQEIKQVEYYKVLLSQTITEAEKYLEKPIRALPYSLYRIFDETGSRKEFEREYFERRGRLNTFAFLSLLEGDDKYINALEDTLWAICDEYTWCIPAHLGGTSNSIIETLNPPDGDRSLLQSSTREHREVIDLFAAETGFAICEILSLLEDRMAPLVVYRARKEVRKRILEPYSKINSLFWWETTTNNWAAVCAGSVGAAAMYLIEDPSALAPILGRLLDTMDCFLSGYQEDGACTEGLGYWKYGFGFFVSFAALLKQRTAGHIDLFKNEKIKQIALFHQKCFLSENKIVSFSDGGLTSNFNPGMIHFLQGLYPEIEIPSSRYMENYTDDNAFRWALAARRLVWSNPSLAGGGLKEASYYLKDSEWLISRFIEDDSVICFAAKGGHNDEPHNHNDVGSFIFHVNGESLLTDMGCGEYTKQYFGPERYSFLCNSSLGHSVPLVEGCSQEAGAEYRAVVLEAFTSREKDHFELDISKAYKNSNLKTLVRRFEFDKSKDLRLVLKDKYEFQSVPSSITERLVSFRQPELIQEGIVRLTGERGSVDIVFNPEELEFNLCKEVFVNHRAVAEDIYIMNLTIKKPDIKSTVQIQFVANKMG